MGDPSPSMAVVTATPSDSSNSEGPRSIRCYSPNGKVPGNPHKITFVKTQHMVKATWEKLKVEFSPFHKGPGQKDLYDNYVRDLGAGMREVVPTLAKTWLKLQPEHQAPLTDYMELYYEVPSTLEMKEFFTKKAGKC